MTPRPTARRQRGAALLLALLIMTLVATLAAGMVWLQWRGIEVETAERARTQAEWLLNASLDWGNLILKSQIRNGQIEDDLTQPWATFSVMRMPLGWSAATGGGQFVAGGRHCCCCCCAAPCVDCTLFQLQPAMLAAAGLQT